MPVLLEIGAQVIVACMMRIWLLTSEYKNPIANHVEISTPLNSWKRVTEGVHLINENTSPYIGDLIHEQPLNLYAFRFIIHYLREYVPVIFIICDVLTAVLLYLTAKQYLTDTRARQMEHLSKVKEKLDEPDEIDEQNDKITLNETSVKFSPMYVFAVYLFNPYVVFNCVAMTTTVFNNFYLALYLYTMVTNRKFLCILSLVLSTTQTLYSIVLICPLLLNLRREQCTKTKTIFISLLFITAICIHQFVSYKICGDFKLFENTYGFILSIPDLQPNIGLFWYFFTEMFEHFRALFILAFQINVLFLYLLPLSIRFTKDPVLLAGSLIILIVIFKSYPCLGEVGLCLALIPIWTHLFGYLQQGFLTSTCFLITTILGPIVWHLWIYSRSANANFYFGVTLSFATAQIFLITDLLFAYIKIEFWLKNRHVRDIDSETAKLTLE